MDGEFKKCPNGHYYLANLGSCPHCKKTGLGTSANPTSMKTQIYDDGSGFQPTSTMGGTKTKFGNETVPMGGPASVDTRPAPQSPNNRTVFGDGSDVSSGYRTTRKLVGWLVSYSLDKMGVDFKLYEGRNIIGRDMDCNITVNDGMVSGKHAVLLYRANKYSITDSQSSHGTFVNGEDIDLDPRYLSDGDTIKIGQTTFLFRTSLL